MTNLSDLLPVGSSDKKAEFTASGAVESGNGVILNSDGTVTAVAATAKTKGAGTLFDTGANAQFDYMSSVYEPVAKKTVIAYRAITNNNYGTAIVATVSGTSVSFGTPVVYKSDDCQYNKATYDASAGKILITFRGVFGWGVAVQGSVSGTEFVVDGDNTYYTAAVTYPAIGYDSSNQRSINVWSDGSQARANTVTVGSSSPSYGTTYVFEANCDNFSVTYHPEANKTVIFYADGNNSNYATAIVVTASGSSLTFGTPTVIASQSSSRFASTYDAAAKQISVVWRSATFSYYPYGGLVNVSGTSVSVSGLFTIYSVRSDSHDVTYDPINKLTIYAVQQQNDYSAAVAFDMSTGSPILAASIEVMSGYACQRTDQYVVVAAADEEQGTTLISQSTSTSVGGFSNVYQPPSSNALPSGKFIGIANSAIANAATGEITLAGGISATGPNLITGKPYYLTNNGAFTSVETSIPVGLAVGTGSEAGYFVLEAQDTGQRAWTDEISGIEDIYVSPDGSNAYYITRGADTVYQYPMSSSYNITSATYDASKTFYVGGQEANPQGLTFKPDGTRMYVCGYTNDTLYQYNLSTAWDITTATYSAAKTLSVSTPAGVAFNSDGSRFYVIDEGNGNCYQWTCSTAYTISNAVSAGQKDLGNLTGGNDMQGVQISPDGYYLYVINDISSTAKYVRVFFLSTAGDVTTAVLAGSLQIPYSIAPGDDYCGISFSNSGKAMYLVTKSDKLSVQFDTSGIATNSILING